MFSTARTYGELIALHRRQSKPRLRRKNGIWFCVSLDGKGTAFGAGASPAEAWHRYDFLCGIFPSK